MITSRDNRGWPGDVEIGQRASTGLPAPSIVRPVKIATVDTQRIVRRIGTLGRADREAVARTVEGYTMLS